MSVTIKLNRKCVELGRMKVNDKGFAVPPAFIVSRPGTHSVRVTEPDVKHMHVYIRRWMPATEIDIPSVQTLTR